MNFSDKSLVLTRLRCFAFLVVFVFGSVLAGFAQTPDEKTPKVQPTASPTPVGNQNPETKDGQIAVALDKNNLSAEQIAESAIFIYGGGLGRLNLNQIRKSTIERGKLLTFDQKGKSESANYEILISRAESLDKEKVRIEKTYPNAKFSLVSNENKIFGIFNNKVFKPTDEAMQEFQNRIWHGLEALLRYKENGATVEKLERQKILGVELYVIDITDQSKRKTRFFISFKSFRIMALEYTENSIKYRRKFYDYNYAQGTLVPYRTVLWADDKKVEETSVNLVSFGQKIEDFMFEEG